MNNESFGCADACSIPNVALQEQEQEQSQNDEDLKRFLSSRTNLPPSTQRLQSSRENDMFAESLMNKALYDPPRWGWTALGGIADVLSPHEVSC